MNFEGKQFLERQICSSLKSLSGILLCEKFVEKNYPWICNRPWIATLLCVHLYIVGFWSMISHLWSNFCTFNYWWWWYDQQKCGTTFTAAVWTWWKMAEYGKLSLTLLTRWTNHSGSFCQCDAVEILTQYIKGPWRRFFLDFLLVCAALFKIIWRLLMMHLMSFYATCKMPFISIPHKFHAMKNQCCFKVAFCELKLLFAGCLLIGAFFMVKYPRRAASCVVSYWAMQCGWNLKNPR